MNECKVCFAQRMSISAISIKVNDLCDMHHRDWVDEKMMGEYL